MPSLSDVPLVGGETDHENGLDPSTERLEAFSDGVIAIAITLLVLEFRLDTTHELGPHLAQLWPTFIGYVVTFSIVGVIWMNHHLMFHFIRRTDRVVLLLNLGILFTVAFLPWPASLLIDGLQSGESARLAAVLYGATLVVGGLFFNALWWYVSGNHRHLGTNITPERALVLRKQFMFGPLSYLVATVVGGFLPWAGLACFLALIVIYMFEAGANRTAA